MNTTGHIRNDGTLPVWTPHVDVAEYPNAIDRLIELMDNEPLNLRLFGSAGFIRKMHVRDFPTVTSGSMSFAGKWRFCGNFERISSVFCIDTDDEETARKLKSAIRSNIRKFF